MRVMVIVKATTDSEAGKLPSAQLMADMGAFNQQLIAAGVMTDGGGLKPTSQGARVAFSGSDRTVIQGSVRQCRGPRRRLLDLEGEGSRRGDRVGQALPQSDAGPIDHRNPSALRDGGLRLTTAAV